MKRLSSFLATSSLLLMAACNDGTSPKHEVEQKPGTLVSSSPLPVENRMPGAGQSLEITYLGTNGITGSGLTPVTGQVIYPASPAPTGGWPIVAWAHGTVGIAKSCAPSLNRPSERNTIYLSEWLKRGFAIVATDYQGLGSDGPHPYLNTRTEAWNVLDSVKAALSGLPDLSNNIMIVGQSQGAGAAFAAAAWAPEYAPSLKIHGTVATGIPYMTPKVIQQILSNPPKSSSDGHPDPVVAYALLIAASEASINPDFKPETAFQPKAMKAFQAASKVCLPELLNIIQADGLTRSNSFEPGLARALAPAMRNMTYPTLKLDAPIFIGTGTEDHDVSPIGQQMLVHDACQAGSTVQAHLYKGEDHSGTVLASMKDSEAFTKDVMSGKPIISNCSPVAK
ncbi:MAG: alpha/beta hydrolase [Acetobacter sp.]|nr:alpha/beta hydrolase [Acetobacter sp.]